MRTFRIQSLVSGFTLPLPSGTSSVGSGRSSGSRVILRAPSRSKTSGGVPFVIAYSGGSAGESPCFGAHPSSLSSPCGRRDPVCSSAYGADMWDTYEKKSAYHGVCGLSVFKVSSVVSLSLYRRERRVWDQAGLLARESSSGRLPGQKPVAVCPSSSLTAAGPRGNRPVSELTPLPYQALAGAVIRYSVMYGRAYVGFAPLCMPRDSHEAQPQPSLDVLPERRIGSKRHLLYLQFFSP